MEPYTTKDMCIICRNDLCIESCYLTSCNHTFYYNCYKQWNNELRPCPICLTCIRFLSFKQKLDQNLCSELARLMFPPVIQYSKIKDVPILEYLIRYSNSEEIFQTFLQCNLSQTSTDELLDAIILGY